MIEIFYKIIYCVLKNMQKNKKIIVSVVVCLVIAILSFSGGMIYAGKNIKDANASRMNQFTQRGFNQGDGQRFGGQGLARGGMGGGFVSGEVLFIDNKSMTVKTQNGGSKIVFFSPTTKVEKTVDGTTADVIVGKQVMITGVANTDGSVNATSVELRTIPLVAPSNLPIKQ